MIFFFLPRGNSPEGKLLKIWDVTTQGRRKSLKIRGIFKKINMNLHEPLSLKMPKSFSFYSLGSSLTHFEIGYVKPFYRKHLVLDIEKKSIVVTADVASGRVDQYFGPVVCISKAETLEKK